MADYIDKLSLQNEESNDNDDELSNATKCDLYAKLFNYEPYVIMTMTYKHTGQLDECSVRQCILYIFRSSNGEADIEQAALIVLENIENLVNVQSMLTSLIVKLKRKYGNL